MKRKVEISGYKSQETYISEEIRSIHQAKNVAQDNFLTIHSPEERNQSGQFFTPELLATDIVKSLNPLLPNQIEFLEPAFGFGSLFSPLLSEGHTLKRAVAYEIDRNIAFKATELWESYIEIYNSDFVQQNAPSKLFNLIISNPPYVRHHHLGTSTKKLVYEEALARTGIKVSGLSSLYVYFVLLSHAWMSPSAIAVWILPTEFMSVNYGVALQEYLTNHVTLLRIHKFPEEQSKFEGALTTSAIIFLRNQKPSYNIEVEFTFGKELTDPTSSFRIGLFMLQKETKWNTFFEDIKPPTSVSSSVVLGDLFEVKRGIATGNNDFFVLSPQVIEQYSIPRELLVPLVPSPRYLSDRDIKADTNGDPIVNKRLYLLNCGHLTINEIEFQYPTLSKYIQQGIENKVHKGYLCSHRKPWYRLESREPALFLLTYMGRKTSTKENPIQFVRNQSKGICLNQYMILYPKVSFSETQLGILWECLQKLDLLEQKNKGRLYAGGLMKMEPSEVKNLEILLPPNFNDCK